MLLVVSTLAACLAVAALAVQPWLTRRRVGVHVRVGGIVAVLVALHVVALFVEDPDDALFSMSPDGPTRARMALFATVLLVVVTLLGVLRRRLRWSPATWRFLHGSLAALVVVLGVGHAVLIQGALDGWGTVGAARARRPRGGRRGVAAGRGPAPGYLTHHPADLIPGG